MTVNFSVDYGVVEKVISTLEVSSNGYQTIQDQLETMRADLCGNGMIGETANALNEYILTLEEKLRQISLRSRILGGNLQAGLDDFRGIDEKMMVRSDIRLEK